jgi:hypothetical protein
LLHWRNRSIEIASNPPVPLAFNLLLFVLEFMTALNDTEYNFVAFLGDLRHKRELVLLLGSIVEAQPYFSNHHQAEYLRAHYPDLVPPPQNGVPASDHSVGTVFEHTFERSLVFRVRYAQFILDIRSRWLQAIGSGSASA